MTHPPVPIAAYLAAVSSDTSILLDALQRASTELVPTCPGWDVARLAGHLGRVHRMATHVVSQKSLERPQAADLPVPPEKLIELSAYVSTGVDNLLTVLRSAPADSPAWNMIDAPQVASFWPRRMAHETFVHRVDAEMAIGAQISPTDIAVCIDGVDEFFDMFRARVLPQHPDAALGGSLHLHATDGDGEWMLRIDNGQQHLEHGHGKGDAAIRGTASSLLLGLWGRANFSSDEFERFGDTALIERFGAFGAF